MWCQVWDKRFKMAESEYCELDEKITGKCTGMCPKDEIIAREKSRRLSVFEMMAGTEKHKFPKANHEICIKEYSRSAAGCKIDVGKLRPASVLLKCMEFLIENVINQEKHERSWLEVYDFVSDRIRAIRQDMVVQRIDSDVVIKILKNAVRFHIVVLEECKTEKDFNRASCLDQLHACLLPLLECVKITKNNSLHDEFGLYYILLNINSTSILLNSIRTLFKDGQFLNRCGNRHLILELALADNFLNYHKLFKIFEKLPYITSCCLAINLNNLRFNSLRIIAKAYSSKNSKLPLEKLTDWLKFDSCQDAKEFCGMTGLDTEKDCVLLNGRQLQDPSRTDALKEIHSWRLTGIKKFKSVLEYIKEGDSF